MRGSATVTRAGREALRRIILPMILAALAGGCSGNGAATNAAPGLLLDGVRLTDLQKDIINLSEDHLLRLSEAVERSQSEGLTPEQRRATYRFRYQSSDAMITNATAENPAVGLVDMIVMLSLQQWAIERSGDELFGPANASLQPVLIASRANFRMLSRRVLESPAIAQIEEVIEAWKAENPDEDTVAHVRLAYIEAGRPQAPGRRPGNAPPRNIFALLALDPLAGLDPAVAEIEQARLLASRSMYQARRLVSTSGWLAQIIYGNIAGSPEAQSLLGQSESVAASVDRISTTVEALPDRLATERDVTLRGVEELVQRQRAATIDDVRMAIAAERTLTARTLEEVMDRQREATIEDVRVAVREESDALFVRIEDAEEPLRGTVNDVQQLVVSTTELVRTVTPENQGGTGSPAAAQGSEFDPAELERLTAQIGDTASQLTELVKTADQLVSSQGLSDSARRVELASQGLVDRIFMRSLLLIIAAGIVLVLALTAARLLTNRFGRPTAS